MLQRLLYGLVAVVIAVSFKLCNKSSDHDNLKADLIKICDEDSECIATVEEHYDNCFESHYSLGGRRRAAHLNQDQFLACFNQHAGKPFFARIQSDE